MTYSELLFWKHYILQKLKQLGLPEFVEVVVLKEPGRMFEYRLMFKHDNKKYMVIKCVPKHDLNVYHRYWLEQTIRGSYWNIMQVVNFPKVYLPKVPE